MDLTETTSEPKQDAERQRKRRRLLPTIAVIVVLGLLVLTPPLINVNRFRKRIATTMSLSLGRPVHLDNVSIHLLPLPGLTLENLVVSEDPSFGYEPVIRANKVVATMRVSSLWRRQVEFSTIRFEVDAHGSGPSVNLVRNAQGRWNLEDILMQASRVNTAPTEQRKAGPAPRFPYIEATGARVNVKFGEEKMPYSLVDTDFALWLPSPQQWRVRLQGKPARTDSNVSDAGVVRVEGSLRRASAMADVPVDLHASWRGSPLGEDSRLLTGEDAGWRGTLFLEATLVGPLSNAVLTTHLQLNDLRRADFVPAKALDITVDCTATASLVKTALLNAQCGVPVDKATPLTLTAGMVDLQHPKAADMKAAVQALPLGWAMNWAKLFSPRVPQELDPGGEVNGDLDWNPAVQSWQGRLSATVPHASGDEGAGGAAAEAATVLNFDVDTSPASARVSPPPVVKLEPVALRPAPSASFMLSGQADVSGYALQLTGSGTVAQVHGLAGEFAPLDAGVEKALAIAPDHGSADEAHADVARGVSLTCTSLWSGTQTCEPLVPVEPAKQPRAARRRHR